MSKINNKRKRTVKVPDEASKDYYKLKTEAVDTLVAALNEDPHEDEQATPVKGEPDPYKIDRLAKIPSWVKVLFIKFWVAGAICYFFRIGLGLVIVSDLDMLVLTGVVTGAITDLFVNTAFLYFESNRKEYHKYMLLPVSCKKIWTLFVNIPFGLLEVVAVYYIYVFINMYIANGSLSVEPLLYGVFFLIVDMVFINIKNLIVYMIRKTKSTTQS